MLAIGAIDIGAGARRCLGGHEFQTSSQDKEGAFERAWVFKLSG